MNNKKCSLRSQPPSRGRRPGDGAPSGYTFLYNKKLKSALLALAALLLLAPLALAQEGYDLSWWTVDGGGDTWSLGEGSPGDGYALGGTVGQPDAGDHAGATAGGGTYILQGGFWDTDPALPPTLAIAKAARDLDGPPLYEGDTVGYAITVTNGTTDTTYTHLVVQDAIPAGTSYVPGSADPPQTSGPDPLVWTLDALPPGESRTFTFRVTVDEGMVGQEIGGNVAAVLADQVDEPLFTQPVRPPGPVLPRPGLTTIRYLPVIARKHTPPGPVRLYLPLVVRAYTAGPPPGDEYEPDNACAQARPLLPGAPQAHTFDPPGDEDWLAVAMTAGQSYILQTGNLSGGADTILQLYAPDCLVLLAENDDYGGELWSRLAWAAPETATYYARVRNYDPTAGGTGVGYAVSVQQAP